MDFLGTTINPREVIASHGDNAVVSRNASGITLNNLLSAVPSANVTHGEPHYVKLHYDNPKFTGAFLYPPGGGQGWHTNSNLAGTRVYAAWSETGNSGMVFYENGRMRVEKDKPGWNVRAFVVPCWHAVWAECWRISVGFNIAGEL